MPNDVQQRIEIEAAVKDSMSEALKALARNLRDTGTRVEDAHKGFVGFNDIVGVVGRTLHGPVGAVAGVAALGVAATKMVTEFAQSRTQLELFANTARLSVREVTAMRNTMELAGVPFEETTKHVGAFSNSLKDMWMNRWGSKAAEQAKQYGDVAVLSIGKVIEAMKGGNVREGIDATLNELRNVAPQHREKMLELYSQIFGIPAPLLEEFLQKYKETLDKVPDINEEAAKKVYNIWTKLRQSLRQEWEGIENDLLKRIAPTLESIERGASKAVEAGRKAREQQDRIDRGEEEPRKPPEQPTDRPSTIWDALKRYRRKSSLGQSEDEAALPSGAQPISYQSNDAEAFRKGGLVGMLESRGTELPEWLKSVAGFFRRSDVTTAMGMAVPTGNMGNWPNWGHMAEKAFTWGDPAMGAVLGGHGAGGGRELLETEQESGKTLIDIRDTLDRMEKGTVGGGGGGDVGGGDGGGIRRPGKPFVGGYSGPGSDSPILQDPGKTGAAAGKLSGAVHGHQVEGFGPPELAGQKLYDPLTASSLGGGVGGTSAKFGPGQHEGVDVMAPVGTSVHSAFEKARVVKTDTQGLDGSITIEQLDSNGQGTGIYARYLHQGPAMVKRGDVLNPGQQIGTSGFRNAPHTHFEMWRGQPGGADSKLLNPRAIYGWGKDSLPKGGQERRALDFKTSSELNNASGTGVRASVFDDASTASGMSRNVPGIALPSREGLGKMHSVTTPDGRTFNLLQTDVGPAGWTGRGVDINRPAASMMGFDYNKFPTDQGRWKIERLGDDEKKRGGKRSDRDAFGDGSSFAQRFDAMQARVNGNKGSISAVVDFKNIPPGVRTGADVDGDIWQDLKVNNLKQAPRADANTSDPYAWAMSP